MFRSNFAMRMTFDELVTLEAKKKDSPTVDGLIFMDVAPNPKKQNRRMLFPCYVTGVAKDKKTDEIVALGIGLIQWMKGIPQVMLIKVSKETVEKGEKIQFWDIAPTKYVLDKYGFNSAEQEAEQAVTDVLNEVFGEDKKL